MCTERRRVRPPLPLVSYRHQPIEPRLTYQTDIAYLPIVMGGSHWHAEVHSRILLSCKGAPSWYVSPSNSGDSFSKRNDVKTWYGARCQFVLSIHAVTLLVGSPSSAMEYVKIKNHPRYTTSLSLAPVLKTPFLTSHYKLS